MPRRGAFSQQQPLRTTSRRSLRQTLQSIANLTWLYDEYQYGATTIYDKSGNANDCTVTAGARIGLPGLGNIAGGGYRNSQTLAVPAAGALTGGSWTHVCCVRAYDFSQSGGDVYSNDSVHNNSFKTRLTGSGSSGYTPTINQRGVGDVTVGTAAITDRQRWHIIIYRMTSPATASIRMDGVDITGSITSRTLSDTASPAPIFAAVDATEMVVLGPQAGFARYLTDSECAQIESAFRLEDVYPKASTTLIGLHQDVSFQSNSAIRHNQFRNARLIHAKISRNSFLWHKVEASQGVYDWSLYDDIVSDAYSNGLQLLCPIYGSPTFYNGYVSGSPNYLSIPGTGVDSTFQTWVSNYVTFITAAITRYQPGGAGNPNSVPIWWEIGNEPNGGFWVDVNGTITPNADQYAYWYCAIRAAITGVDASAKVVAGATTSWYVGSASYIYGNVFMRSVLTSAYWTGAGAVLDWWSHHPYESGNASPDDHSNFQNHFDHLIQVRDVLCEMGYPNTGVFASEFGWASTTSEADQSAKLGVGLNRWRDYFGLGQTFGIATVYHDYSGSDNNGIFTNMPSDGSDATQKAAAGMFSAFAKPYD